MKNFLRVVAMALRRRFVFAGALACSLIVALLWGGNLGLVKPLVEVAFSGKTPHRWAHDEVQRSADNVALFRVKLATLKAAKDADSAAARQQIAGLEVKLAAEEQALRLARTLEPWVVRYLPNDTFLTLAILVGLLLVATLLKDGLFVAQLIMVERLTQLAILDLRKQFFRRTLRLEIATFSNDRTSNLLSRFTSDLNHIGGGINAVLGRVMLEPLKMIACLAGAAYICWRLLLVSLIVAPLAVYVIGKLSQSLKRANRRAMQEMSQIYALVSETFAGIHAVKAFGMERRERQRFHRCGKQYYRKSMRIILYNALGRASSELLGMGVICVAIIVGAYLVLNEKTTLLGMKMMDRPLSPSSLLAFYALLAGVSDPARKLAEVLNYLQKGMAAADRVFEMLDREPKIVDPPHPRTVASSQPELVFDRVTFHYQPGQNVLRDVELRIPFGQTVAIVGPNGCGKSTLANLLPRFYDPVEGAVRLDGIDIRELRLRDLRQMFGLVAQQAMLFDDSVRDNIRYGSPHATDAEVVAAAEQAHAHKFIAEKLERGYDTVVGERGGKLSGGQRQRILLARAILRNPKFLVLDEATSQIDLESEQLIHKVLEQFTRGRTTLMITHRLSSLALADRIVVMDSGRIIDAGSHDDLLSRCDLYCRLYQVGFRHAA